MAESHVTDEDRAELAEIARLAAQVKKDRQRVLARIRQRKRRAVKEAA